MKFFGSRKFKLIGFVITLLFVSVNLSWGAQELGEDNLSWKEEFPTQESDLRLQRFIGDKSNLYLQASDTVVSIDARDGSENWRFLSSKFSQTVLDKATLLNSKQYGQAEDYVYWTSLDAFRGDPDGDTLVAINNLGNEQFDFNYDLNAADYELVDFGFTANHIKIKVDMKSTDYTDSTVTHKLDTGDSTLRAGEWAFAGDKVFQIKVDPSSNSTDMSAYDEADLSEKLWGPVTFQNSQDFKGDDKAEFAYVAQSVSSDTFKKITDVDLNTGDTSLVRDNNASEAFSLDSPFLAVFPDINALIIHDRSDSKLVSVKTDALNDTNWEIKLSDSYTYSEIEHRAEDLGDPLFVELDSDTLVAIDKSSGTIKWDYEYYSANSCEFFEVNSDSVFLKLDGLSDTVVALNKADGTEAWRYQGSQIFQPAEDAGFVDEGGKLYDRGFGGGAPISRLDKTTGETMWTKQNVVDYEIARDRVVLVQRENGTERFTVYHADSGESIAYVSEIDLDGDDKSDTIKSMKITYVESSQSSADWTHSGFDFGGKVYIKFIPSGSPNSTRLAALDLTDYSSGSSDGGSSSSSSGGCIIQKSGAPGWLNNSLRSLRDKGLETMPGRALTSMYYSLFGEAETTE